MEMMRKQIWIDQEVYHDQQWLKKQPLKFLKDNFQQSLLFSWFPSYLDVTRLRYCWLSKVSPVVCTSHDPDVGRGRTQTQEKPYKSKNIDQIGGWDSAWGCWGWKLLTLPDEVLECHGAAVEEQAGTECKIDTGGGGGEEEEEEVEEEREV